MIVDQFGKAVGSASKSSETTRYFLRELEKRIPSMWREDFGDGATCNLFSTTELYDQYGIVIPPTFAGTDTITIRKPKMYAEKGA